MYWIFSKKFRCVFGDFSMGGRFNEELVYDKRHSRERSVFTRWYSSLIRFWSEESTKGSLSA